MRSLSKNGMKKAQASVESIILLAVIVVVISSILVFREEVMSGLSSSHYATKAGLLGEKVTDAAVMIYQQGEGARTVIYVNVPEEISGIDFKGNTMEITYNISGESTTVYSKTDFILNGSIPEQGGNYCLLLESFQGYVEVSNYNSSC